MNVVPEQQATNTVLLIRPSAFCSNSETAASNTFQCARGLSHPGAEQAAAVREFDGLVQGLEAAGVRVLVFADQVESASPDAVFPNNWVSFHADGTAVLYPMMAPNRRTERRRDILERLSGEHGFRIGRVVDLSGYEASGRFLEGTGSLVLDRVNRVAYAGISLRTDTQVLADAVRRLDYEPVTFTATDENGSPVYHTNVMLCVGEDFAVVCEEAIGDPGQRKAVRKRLEQTGHEIVPISRSQMRSFAANALEIIDRQGRRCLVLSTRALQSLSENQVERLASRCRLLPTPLSTIERSGGGSARCMLAEVHLPRRVSAS